MVLSGEGLSVLVDLQPFVRDFADLCGSMVSDKNFGAMCCVGAGCEEPFLRWEGRLTRVLLNLWRNVIKLADAGKIFVSIEYLPEEETLKFSV